MRADDKPDKAGVCGSLFSVSASRLLCSPEYTTWAELKHFLDHGSRERALRKDVALNHIHWATTRRCEIPHLMAFAIDHRIQLEALAADEATQMGGSDPAQMVTPLEAELIHIEAGKARDQGIADPRLAGRVAVGAEARIVLDAFPELVLPATITFVANVAQFTPKTVETEAERQKLERRRRAQSGGRRAPQQRLRIAVRLSCLPDKQLAPPQEAIVGFEIVDMFGGDALAIGGAKLRASADGRQHRKKVAKSRSDEDAYKTAAASGGCCW